MGSLKTISKESKEYNPNCYSMDFTMGILGLNSVQCQRKQKYSHGTSVPFLQIKSLLILGGFSHISSHNVRLSVCMGGCLKNVATRWLNIKVTIIEHLVSPVVMSFPPRSSLASHYTEIKN